MCYAKGIFSPLPFLNTDEPLEGMGKTQSQHGQPKSQAQAEPLHKPKLF